MLLRLSVRDFVIVERLELEIHTGMTVLTGETGAGKSILVDALGLALGERANNSLIRPGCERAEVCAVFDAPSGGEVRAWLRSQELLADDAECILRRVVSEDGRSRAWINGSPVPVQALRELGDRLVDIHGQHAHQSLLRRAVQRQIVDEFGGHAAQLTALAACCGRAAALQGEIEELAGGPHTEHERLELLRYQARELHELDLKPGEFEDVTAEHRRLAHAAELIAACQDACDRLEGDSEAALLTQLPLVLRALDGIQDLDPRIGGVREMLESASIQLQEAATDLRHYQDGLELDPERLQWFERRLESIHALARKYRVTPAELATLGERVAQEIEALEQREGRLEGLRTELARVHGEYRERARELHTLRVAAAKRLAAEVTTNVEQLGMPGGRFAIAVEHLADAEPSPTGTDRVEFRVSADPGQPLQPLARVASGGELSRISLAIQVIASQGSGVPTLVFDEVDTGIGGRVAEIVGQQLRRLGAHRQVLCVTHLPQVAAQAQHHIQVRKRTEPAGTHASLEDLAGEKRVQEIARMLGGVRITQRTLAHAREMLAVCSQRGGDGTSSPSR